MTGGITGTTGSTDTTSVDVNPPPILGNLLNPTVSNVTAPKSSGFNDKTIQQIFGATRPTKN
jgi:hypothetical protein